MAFLLEPRNRIVIPRWRSFERGFSNDEIIILKNNIIEPIFDHTILKDKIDDWKNKPNISNALELVNASYSLGLNEIAIDAAKFLLTNKQTLTPSLKEILNQILGLEKKPKQIQETSFLFENFLKVSGEQIRLLRKKLKENPNNPLLWTTLARNYSILGDFEKANKAIIVALDLTRYSNTYIQRIASRFYYHLGETERALHLVRKSKDHEVDPWLMSIDIAYSTKLGRYNKNLTIASRMLESNKFSNLDLTELASSLGTAQLHTGSAKEARKSFEISMRAPNENSFAQIEFASSLFPIFQKKDFSNYFNLLFNAYEARAHEFESEGKFEDAFENGCRWLLDQPISKRAAIFTQHLAITKLERYDKGVEIGKFALHSNPNSFEIYNNITYAYAKKGELKNASISLERMRSLVSNPVHKIFMLATEGLVRIREGNSLAGKKLYNEAIELSIAENQLLLKDLAIYNYLRETYRAEGTFEIEYISRLEKNSSIVKELNELMKKSNLI